MILFTVKVDSFVDVITNSSSVLFVKKDHAKEAVEELIQKMYPDYLNEYVELRGIDDLSDEELYEYIESSFCYWSNHRQCFVNNVISGFKTEEMFRPTRRGGLFLRDDFVVNHRDRIIESVDPDRMLFFLFSKDDNPDWDMQEKLESVMTRYHLG